MARAVDRSITLAGSYSDHVQLTQLKKVLADDLIRFPDS